MKVVLARPNYKTHLITPPLGIGYLSSYLKSKDVPCQIIDGLNLNLTNSEIAQKCVSADVIGISILSNYFLKATDLSKKLKKMGKVVVVGGPHATALPQLTLTKTKADYLIIGEGEKALYKLIKAVREGRKKKDIKIKGVFSSVHKNLSFAPFTFNLSSLPWPDWEQIDPRTYQKAPHGGLVKHFPVAPIITSRGCPYECKFCASPYLWQRQIRFRQPAEVIREIKYLIKNFGVGEIHIEDDNFTLNRKHAEEICQRLIREKIKISWATPNGIRADKIDLELLKLMKKAGCYSLALGIESGNQEILKRVAKHSCLTTIKRAVRLAHEVGLITQGFFIFGLPGETPETIRQTINFAKNLPLEKAQFLYLDVIPGSALWKELKFDQKVAWDLESFQEISWLPPTVDRKTLSQAQGKAFREFFFRPKQLAGLAGLAKPSQLRYILRRVRDFKILKFCPF
jgi:radical SAM superfamily enzyme YgiQ (UPF0313 family)